MNDLYEVSPVQQHELQQGLTVLHARRNKMRLLAVLSGLITVVSLIGLLFNQSLVYAFFDVSNTVQQLHIPLSAVGIENSIGQTADYFGRLLAWIVWFCVTAVVSLVGASLIVHYAKKIKFFQRRLQYFGKRFLAWVICVMLIWMGSGWLKTEIVSDDQEEYTEFVSYSNHISQSEIYQYLQRSQIPETAQDYLLAQTALLQKNVDQDTALAYSSKLIEAEKTDPQFLSYGFKPQQLWSIQQQVYGKAVTPLAESVADKIAIADNVKQYTQWLWLAMLAVFISLTVMFYSLLRQFNTRLSRIVQRLQ